MSYSVIKFEEFRKPARLINKVFIHCTAADNEGVNFEGINLAATVNTWHKQRGFNEIGYHFVIDKKGNIITGRSLEKVPAAQKGFNSRSIAICCHGLDIKKFTPVQLIAIKNLCQKINTAYNGLVTFHGHREVEPNKTCPVFDYNTLLGFSPVIDSTTSNK